jgi:predicted nucleic acid-binding protein
MGRNHVRSLGGPKASRGQNPQSRARGASAETALIVYADSSVLVAWFHADDQFAQEVTDWVREYVTDFIWNPFLRVEVRHNLRKLKTPYARTAWNALRAAEKTGRLSIGRINLHDLLDAADDLSAEKANAIPAGTWDFFHVAAAIQTKAHCFATCDRLQADLALQCGFAGTKLKYFKP